MPGETESVAVAVQEFHATLSHALRGTRFIFKREAGAFAAALASDLVELKENLDEPRAGVEALAEFFRLDEALFNRCDDSDGRVGDVFRLDARDLFVHYADRCDDKAWLGGLILELQQESNYGVRDCLFEVASQFLPEPVLRDLVEQLWVLARREPEVYRQRKWLFLIESLARQMRDPGLFEKASRAVSPQIHTAQCIDIAEVYLESGDATTALEWLNRLSPDERFEAYRRDEILLAACQKLGRKEDAVKVAWRIFRRCRLDTTFQQLVNVIGLHDRQALLDEEARVILRSSELSYTDAAFLLWCGRIDDTETYLLARSKKIVGDSYYSILPLAEALEREQGFLAATVLYRALLETILRRAISKYYGHGIRYLRKLDKIAPRVTDWGQVVSHEVYFEKLREEHRRKSSFWGRWEGRKGLWINRNDESVE